VAGASGGDVQVNYTARGTGDQSLDRLISDIATAFKRIEKLAGAPFGYVPLGPTGSSILRSSETT